MQEHVGYGVASGMIVLAIIRNAWRKKYRIAPDMLEYFSMYNLANVFRARAPYAPVNNSKKKLSHTFTLYTPITIGGRYKHNARE